MGRMRARELCQLLVRTLLQQRWVLCLLRLHHLSQRAKAPLLSSPLWMVSISLSLSLSLSIYIYIYTHTFYKLREDVYTYTYLRRVPIVTIWPRRLNGWPIPFSLCSLLFSLHTGHLQMIELKGGLKGDISPRVLWEIDPNFPKSKIFECSQCFAASALDICGKKEQRRMITSMCCCCILPTT